MISRQQQLSELATHWRASDVESCRCVAESLGFVLHREDIQLLNKNLYGSLSVEDLLSCLVEACESKSGVSFRCLKNTGFARTPSTISLMMVLTEPDTLLIALLHGQSDEVLSPMAPWTAAEWISMLQQQSAASILAHLEPPCRRFHRLKRTNTTDPLIDQTNDEERLWHAVFREPFNAELRMVLADVLLEHGDWRGECLQHMLMHELRESKPASFDKDMTSWALKYRKELGENVLSLKLFRGLPHHMTIRLNSLLNGELSWFLKYPIVIVEPLASSVYTLNRLARNDVSQHLRGLHWGVEEQTSFNQKRFFIPEESMPDLHFPALEIFHLPNANWNAQRLTPIFKHLYTPKLNCVRIANLPFIFSESVLGLLSPQWSNAHFYWFECSNDSLYDFQPRQCEFLQKEQQAIEYFADLSIQIDNFSLRRVIHRVDEMLKNLLSWKHVSKLQGLLLNEPKCSNTSLKILLDNSHRLPSLKLLALGRMQLTESMLRDLMESSLGQQLIELDLQEAQIPRNELLSWIQWLDDQPSLHLQHLLLSYKMALDLPTQWLNHVRKRYKQHSLTQMLRRGRLDY